MRQYCRHCAYCIPHRDYDKAYYCIDHEEEITLAGARRTNNCPDFQLSELGDVDTGKEYKERHQKRDDGSKPISVWEYIDNKGVRLG